MWKPDIVAKFLVIMVHPPSQNYVSPPTRHFQTKISTYGR
jgi:hypothetical protein